MSQSEGNRYDIGQISRPSWYTGSSRYDWRIIGADSVQEGDAITMTIEGTNAPNGTNWPIVVRTESNTASQQDFDENWDIYLQLENPDSWQTGFWRSTFTIQTTNDNQIENNEQLLVNLYDSTSLNRVWTSKSITIVDNDSSSSSQPEPDISSSTSEGPGELVIETVPLSTGNKVVNNNGYVNNMETTPLGSENILANSREFLSDAVDSLTGQSDINKALMGGNDFLEVTGGANNFANGNTGEDHIILRGGLGRYLGGKDNDKIEVFGTEAGSWVNGNRGVDYVTGSIDGVTYRGGADNDILAVSAGTVWGDKGADTFQAIGGGGVAIVQDYTSGEDLIQGLAGGGFTVTEQGVAYGVGDDQMLLLTGINDVSQVTLI